MIEEVIINIVFAIIVYVGTFFALKWMAKTADTLIERYIIVFLGILIYICMTVFLLDYYNIPTSFGYTFRVDAKTWLNCIFCVIGSLAGGFLAMIVARMQIEKSEESNRERDKEENRLKYMPLLKYDFLDNCRLNSVEEFIMLSKKDKGCYFNIIMKIENIGLAPIRNMYIKSRGDNIYETSHNFENNGVLKIDESVYSLFGTQLPEGNQKVYLEIIYQDILSNAYSQVIEFDVDIDRSNMNKPSSYTYKINKETIIKDNNIKDSLNNKKI